MRNFPAFKPGLTVYGKACHMRKHLAVRVFPCLRCIRADICPCYDMSILSLYLAPHYILREKILQRIVWAVDEFVAFTNWKYKK